MQFKILSLTHVTFCPQGGATLKVVLSRFSGFFVGIKPKLNCLNDGTVSFDEQQRIVLVLTQVGLWIEDLPERSRCAQFESFFSVLESSRAVN